MQVKKVKACANQYNGFVNGAGGFMVSGHLFILGLVLAIDFKMRLFIRGGHAVGHSRSPRSQRHVIDKRN